MEEQPYGLITPQQRREITALYLRVSAEVESRECLTFDEMVAAIVRFYTDENYTLAEVITHIHQSAAFREAEGKEAYQRANKEASRLVSDWGTLPSH
jgi:hypothetical protein